MNIKYEFFAYICDRMVYILVTINLKQKNNTNETLVASQMK